MHELSYRFAFKMETEARRGLGYADVPDGTSSKNRSKGNEGIRLKVNRYQYSGFTGGGLFSFCPASSNSPLALRLALSILMTPI